MNSLKSRYSNRAARVAQFLILWVVLAASAMLVADKFYFRAPERTLVRAEILVTMSLPKAEIFVPETSFYVQALPAKTALEMVDGVVDRVQFAALGSLISGLIFASLIFWILAKTLNKKSEDVHLRGSRMASASELKKQIASRRK